MSKKKSHQEFMSELEVKVPNWRELYPNLGPYIDSNTKMTFDGKYSQMLYSPKYIILGKTPTVECAVNKDTYLFNKLLHIRPDLQGKVHSLKRYLKTKHYVSFDTQWGRCKMGYTDLSGGARITVRAAFDKEDYLQRKLTDVNITDRRVIKYVNCKNIHITCEFGSASVTINRLFINKTITIDSAINKSDFYIKQADKVHQNFYKYPNLHYKKCTDKFTIVCPLHGPFVQEANSHLTGRGCSNCKLDAIGYKNWCKNCNKKRNSNPMLYVIRCWNHCEEFYKVGITYVNLKNRYGISTTKFRKDMPYQYEIIQKIHGTCEQVQAWECSLHSIYKKLDFHYSPKIAFCGSATECYKITY